MVTDHRAELERRPALRALYGHWATRISSHLSSREGPVVELGCGSAALSEHLSPRVRSYLRTDLFPTPWVDVVVDACAMPFSSGACSNLVAVDMLHHLGEPARFFSEVDRVLSAGGRCVLLEPYISPGSYPLYRFAHHEPLDLRADPFAEVEGREASGGPCNEAIGTLAFTSHRRRFCARWPRLRIVTVELSDWLVYLMTGGYSRPALIPATWVSRLLPLENRLIRHLGKAVALRMVIVLEKTES